MSPRNHPDEDEIIDLAIMGEMLDGLSPVIPPPDLRAKVLERIRGITPSDAYLTLRQPQGWKSLVPGIEVKLLLVDKEAGSKTFLLRAAPGAAVPAHEHQGDEECLVLEGEFSIDDLTLRAGDYHRAVKGTMHGVSTTRTGVLVHMRTSIVDYPGIC